MKATLEKTFAGLVALLICTGASPAADLHQIVEVQSGYLFGAISDGKWIKADETAKLIADETASWKLFDGAVTARRCGKSGNAGRRRRVPPKSLRKKGR